jgi:hypothetical protein
MRFTSILAVSCFCCAALVSCGDDGGELDRAAHRPPKVTSLFTNIDIGNLQAATRGHFRVVMNEGAVCNSKPGTPGGFMTMTPPGRKLQRFQVGGEITQAKIDGLLSELKARVRALVEANGATITGGVGASILDRPIASLALTGIRPKVNCAGLLGFSLHYEDAGGMGAVDVMATRIESEEDAESWEVAFVIHESANAE